MASVFDEETNGTHDPGRGGASTTPPIADAPAAHPTFVIASASAAAVPITQPLGATKVRELLSQGILQDVAKARRDAGVA
jgi:hypothetical protein